MRILIISSFLPYPLHSGGHVRLYNLMKQLAKHHRLTLVCEKRSYQNSKDIAEIKKLCEEVYCVDRKRQWSSANMVKAGISPHPFLLVGHTQAKMKEIIVRLLQEKTFDLIHVETFYVMQNLPKTYLPVVLAEHNIEYQVYRKYVDTAPLPVRPLLLVDIEKIKYWERKFWKQATKLIAVSEIDKQEMGRQDTVVVANGVNLDIFPFVSASKKFSQKEKKILFIGDFKWVQNREAANWIIDRIWPEVEKRIEHSGSKIKAKLWIVGKHIPEDIKAMRGENIIIDENAPDETSKIYQNSFLLLAPITVGGGTSYKILEAMASGVPVVTTQLGVKGLGALHKIHALVGETTNALAQEMLLLFEDKEEYERIGKAARKFIQEKFSWEHIAAMLEKVYQETKETYYD